MGSPPKRNAPFTINSEDIFAKLYRTQSGIEVMCETILTILGIDDLSAVCPNNLLINIGMDFIKQNLLRKKLKEDFGVKLMDCDLETMTIGKLYDLVTEVQQFQNHLIRRKEKVENKLLNFKLFIGLAVDRTRLEYSSTIMYEMNTKPSRFFTTICAISLPGLDNDVTKFVDMAHSISFSMFVVKYGNKERFVHAFANDILQDIEKLCHDKDTFQLVGYSFGSLIAIELARALEKLNKNVQIICIDGSPLLFERSFESFDFAEKRSFHLELATHIAQSFHSHRLPALFRNELKRLKTWNCMVQWLTELIGKLYSNVPAENFQSVCKGVLNRTHAAAAFAFDANESIHSPITLIKSNAEIIHHIAYDYGLKLCSTNCINVNIFDGDHYTILENYDVVNVINGISY